MQGSVAQVIALTVHGNGALTSLPAYKPDQFFPGNSTFQFCESVRFMDLARTGEGWDEIEYAPDPCSWFDRLKSDGVSSLRMNYLPTEAGDGEKLVPDRMTVGFVGGGGRWLIEAERPSGADYWEGRWDLGDQGREDQKIWRVKYGRLARNEPPMADKENDLETEKIALRTSLEAIAEFARSEKMDNFVEAFSNGIIRLSSDDPFAFVYHADLAPIGFLQTSAAQLLASTQTAWVFGGMGSWNDVGFDGEVRARYDQLSDQLYARLNSAIVAATNSSARRGSPPPSPTKWWHRLWRSKT